ncbi:MAG: TonB-dependent receptor [Holophagales bacterium]|nr:TonB-dependent receptor [Holophagales bacterium]MYH24712.1 TonB-dependent receptor [Holophagales bacterium]
MNDKTSLDVPRPWGGARCRSRLLWLHAAAAVLLVAPVAARQDDAAGAEPATIEEEIVVSANRYEVPASEVGSAVTVIDGEEIERRNPVAVLDLLRTVPGTEVTHAGGPGKIATVRVRGGSGAQALVLVDGVRVNSVTGGTVDFAHLLAANIERIEVLRGPQATYGSEAMTGVVSITTGRGMKGWRLSGTGETGTHDHRRFELGLLGAADRWDVSVSATSLRTDGVSHRAIEGGAVEDDPYENQTWSTRLGAAFAGDGRIDLRARSYRGDTAVDGFGFEDLNAMAAQDEDTVALTVEKDLSSFWRQTVRLGQTDATLLGTDPDTIWNNYEIRSEIRQIDLQSDITLGTNNVLNLGLGTENRRGASVGTFDEEADLDSWFVQDQWSITDDVHVTAALRGDEHSTFGSETSHRVTVSGGWSDGRGRLHGSYGTAFRAPNFNELYFPFSGDPNLLPETTEGFDIGLQQRLGDSGVTLDLTWFDIDFDQLIEFDLTSFTFGNVARASSSGAEFTLRYRPDVSTSVEFSHTYNRTEDEATGNPLARRPKNRTTAVAQLQPTDRFTAAAMVAFVSDRTDSDGAVMDDYTKVDLHLSYILSWLRPFVRIENLLDEDYFEVPGFVTPGRTFVVGLRLLRR